MCTVSVIVIVYNDARFIARAIQSVLSQTYPEVEIIVVDDGSDRDNSFAIARTYCSQGVRVFTKKNGGAASARNFGARKATGEYLAFLDSDDVWLPERVTKLMEVFEHRQDLAVAYNGFHFVNENLRPVRHPFFAESSDPYSDLIRCRYPLLPSTMLIHRKVLDTVGGFPEGRSVSGYEDAVFSLLATKMFKTVAVRDPLTLYNYSNSGMGRAVVYDYAMSVARQIAVFGCLQGRLPEEEITLFEQAAWVNNFCKFSMYGELKSARRLKKEMNIKWCDIARSVRGCLALVSSFSRVNILCFSRRLYQWVYSHRHNSIKL